MLNHKWVSQIRGTHPYKLLVLYIQFVQLMNKVVYTFLSSENQVPTVLDHLRQIFVSNVARPQFMANVKQEHCCVVQELVAVHARVLLAFEIDALLEAWCQPGTDGLRLVVVAVHGASV